MRLPRFAVLPAAAALVLAACTTGGGSTPVPLTASPAEPTPVVPTPSPAADAGTYWLRLTTWQAIPPLNLFAVPDAQVITGDGILVTAGAVPAIFPGPLVMPLFGQQVSEVGRARILAWAKELGLLNGQPDFMGSGGLPGGITGRIELTVDGKRVTLSGLTGDGMGASSPDPGSPDAFMEMWRRLTNLPTMMQAELGPQTPFMTAAYAILIGPAPMPQDGINPSIMDWPLDTHIGDFGTPVANGSARCGLVEGADAAVLGAALAKANQLTQWVQDPTTSATFGLTVRPLVAGEDPCREIFGPA